MASVSAALLLAVVVVVGILTATTNAQYPAASVPCSPAQLNWTLVNITGVTNKYFTATVNDITEFEFRLIALDGLPLGWKELYDLDEDDDSGINYDCFVQTTTDDSACTNTYIAAGQVIPNFENRQIKFGFEKCPEWNAATHSTNIAIQLWHRPTIGNLPTIPVCAAFTEATPTAYCNRDAASAVQFGALTTILGAFVILFIL